MLLFYIPTTTTGRHRMATATAADDAHPMKSITNVFVCECVGA